MLKQSLLVAASALSLTFFAPIASGQDETVSMTDNVDIAPLSRQYIEFAYSDAEAGFNGMHLAGLYHYNEDYHVVAEAGLLRGHSINYKHVFVGAQRHFELSLLDNPYLKLIPAARAGLIYSAFDGDSEYGVLLGGRLKSPFKPGLILESGMDWHSTGENKGIVLLLRASYDITDSLYVHSTYWAGDLDELTVGIGTTF